MFKRLLIPGLAITALSLIPSPVRAANFYLDSFNYTNGSTTLQEVSVGQGTPPPRSSTLSNLSEVLGQVRTLEINNPLNNPQRHSTATRFYVNPASGADHLNYTNFSGVVSNALVRYDGGNSTNGLTALGLGNWKDLTSQYHIDYFQMKLLSLNTRLNINFKITDTLGNTASVLRVARRNTTTNDIEIFNSLTSTNVIGNKGIVTFNLTDFANVDFRSVKSVQVELTGQADADATIDYIKGMEVPEPSLGIGTIIFFGLGLASVKRNKRGSEDELE